MILHMEALPPGSWITVQHYAADGSMTDVSAWPVFVVAIEEDDVDNQTPILLDNELDWHRPRPARKTITLHSSPEDACSHLRRVTRHAEPSEIRLLEDAIYRITEATE